METTIQTSQNVRTAYHIMKLTYGIVPIVAGLDKFTNLLTNWEQYLHPAIVHILPFSPHTFMLMVGLIEIIAGLVVLAKPGIGAYIVMAWLACIALQIVAGNRYLDVAVRDLVMAIGAFSLARLANGFQTTYMQQSTHRTTAFS